MTYKLTFGTDRIKGTGVDETFVGVGAKSGKFTLGSADTLDGAGGHDRIDALLASLLFGRRRD